MISSRDLIFKRDSWGRFILDGRAVGFDGFVEEACALLTGALGAACICAAGADVGADGIEDARVGVCVEAPDVKKDIGVGAVDFDVEV